MPKIDFSILKKKKGPLPVWAWALISSVLVYMLYRHFQNQQPSEAPATAGTGASAGPLPGDVNPDTPPNAGTGPGEAFPDKGITSDFQDFMSQLEAQALANQNHDNDQKNPTDSTTTPDNSAALGLTHISGDYWWDPEQHKLIKIPGSGGTKKGSGKKKIPNKSKTKGKKKEQKKPNRPGKIRHAPTSKPHSRPGRPIRRPPQKVKPKVQPRPKTKPLTAAQRAAIERHHHPSTRPPIKKPSKNQKVRQLPKRPYRGKH